MQIASSTFSTPEKCLRGFLPFSLGFWSFNAECAIGTPRRRQQRCVILEKVMFKRGRKTCSWWWMVEGVCCHKRGEDSRSRGRQNGIHRR